MPTDTNNANGNATDVNEVVRDEFGRTEAERTVVLSPRDAEEVNREVELGKHTTYDDALAYQLAHGRKELERTRKQQATLRAARVVQAQIEVHKTILASHPELIADPNFVAKMMAALGVKTPAAR